MIRPCRGRYALNLKERFNAQMHYQPVDRSVLWDFGFWKETLVVWHDQGLPASITDPYNASKGTQPFFGMDRQCHGVLDTGLRPAFEQKLIEDRGDHEVIQQANGVRVLRRKFMSSIPHHEGHILVDRASWREHYKPRLDPAAPGRLPDNIPHLVADARQHGTVLAVNAGSLYGWIRDWMGMENLALVVYDDPAWFEEMVATVADCVVATLRGYFAAGGQADACMMWEDMCYNAGPLLSPRHFEHFLVPHYRRITDVLQSAGVDVIWVDCDGNIEQLLPLWLEAGVNCMFPVEIGNWGADPVKYRREYGRELLMMGGFDKHILASDREAIAAEVRRLAPLVEEGGFIGFCDHRVPPDVPLANYCFYVEQVRKIWGRGVNLPAIDPRVAQLAADA